MTLQAQFHKDLTSMIRVAVQLDKHYEKTQANLDNYIEKFIALTHSFNEKYKGVQLKFSQKIDYIGMKLLLDAKTMSEAFEVAVQMPGIQSVGLHGFHQGQQDTATITETAARARDTLFLTFLHNEIGFGTVFLRFDKREEKVELVYDPEVIVNEPSFEFQLALKFAGKEEYKPEIKINNEAAAFGFSDWLLNSERQKYHEKFDPRFDE